MDLQHITISPTRIPFPVLGHICDTEDISYLLLGKCDIERWLHMETNCIIGVNLGGGVGMVKYLIPFLIR